MAAPNINNPLNQSGPAPNPDDASTGSQATSSAPGTSTREILQTAIAAIQGSEENKSVAALTLDHLIQEQIDRIGYVTGPQPTPETAPDGTTQGTGGRVTKLAALQNIQTQLNNLIASIQAAGSDPSALEAQGLTPTGSSNTEVGSP